MTDTEKIKRITKLLNDLSLDDISRDHLETELMNTSINEIIEFIWELYCFASDVCDTLNDYD